MGRQELPGNIHLPAGLISIALFSAATGSVGAPLLTSVSTELGVSPAAAQWTLTSTLFSGSIAAPILGRLGTGPGRRKTVLVTLLLVVLGGALSTLPLPFAFLVIARALQGLALGLVALLMSIALDRLPAGKAGPTVSSLAVAAMLGTGVGFPLIGLIDQYAGLRPAYAVGFLLSVIALIIAWRTLPTEPVGPSSKIDIPGATLFALGTLGGLLAISEPSIWRHPWLGFGLVFASIGLLGIWVIVELKVEAPLVDLRLTTRPAVLRANIAFLTIGAGMYLLFSVLTRYLQTPEEASYGFGLPGSVAGAALIPFSICGFFAGRLIPAALARYSERLAFTAAACSVALAVAAFVIAPDLLVVVVAAMALLGLGVGGSSSIMPRLILKSVPVSESASVLATNQIARAVSASIGSALAGMLLSETVGEKIFLPPQSDYVNAALWVFPFVAVSIAVITVGPARRFNSEG